MHTIWKILPAAALVAAVVCPERAGAKTANWSVLPIYDTMEQLTPGVYKVKRGYYTGVIDGDGKEIIKMTTDSITPFVDGQALQLTPSEGGRYRLQAILDTDMHSQPVFEEVYVEDYPFFSDGLLPVCNNQGFYGYMDGCGRMVLKPSYINVHPFNNGMAAVVKRPSNIIMQFLSKAKDKIMEAFKQKVSVTYINRAGKELKLSKVINKVVNGSTFNNGQALVEDKDGAFFIINEQGAVVQRCGALNPEFDDRYIYIDENYTGNDESTMASAEVDNSIRLYKQGGKYGYTFNGSILLPAQFEDADLFADGHAMACRDGRWGILRVESGDITCHAPVGAKATSRKGKKGTANTAGAKGFVVNTPESLSNASLTLTLNAGGKETSETVAGNGTTGRMFELVKPAGSYTMTLATKDLVLWSGTTSGDVNGVARQSAQTQRVRISISPSSAKADIKDNAIVTVTFTNPGDIDVSTSVQIAGKGLTPVSRTLNIPAKSSRRISTVFTKVYERETRTVTAKAGGFATSKNITVSPFYVKM